jgi:hypothetical protein
LSIFALAEAKLYLPHSGAHCYAGHGGTPVDAKDTVMSNVKLADCEAACDSKGKCTAVTFLVTKQDYHNPSGDCYLRSEVNLDKCDKTDLPIAVLLDPTQDSAKSKWNTYTQVPPPPLQGNIFYHLFEPKYTGLANKDAGDFKGDAAFIFLTFSNYSKGNPEASIDHNIIEMSEVNVTGWGTYEYCNAPGAFGHHTCPETSKDYCCTVKDEQGHDVVTNHTSTQLPGLEIPNHALSDGSIGFWLSFPRESQGVTWTEKLLRRINGKCLADAWRTDAGGCSSCGEASDKCVADCIQDKMTLQEIHTTWDRVFADPDECPEVPLPGSSVAV